MESVELSAKSVEEAVQQALTRLGKTRDEVEVTVLNEGHRGLLGFVRGDSARVRVTVRSSSGEPQARETSGRPPRAGGGRSAAARPQTAPRPAATPRQATAPRLAATKPAPQPRPAVPPKPNETAIVARDTLEELLEKMNIDADVVYGGGTGDEDSPILLDIEGEELGILIGRRGETLSSMQFLLNLMINKRLGTWARTVIDVEGYRARREESLRSLATRVADRVRRTGQPITLEPMPPNERRIVHLSLQDNPDVTTESSGFGEDRRVTVMLRSADRG